MASEKTVPISLGEDCSEYGIPLMITSLCNRGLLLFNGEMSDANLGHEETFEYS